MLRVIEYIIKKVTTPRSHTEMTLFIVQRRKHPRTTRELMASMYKIG